jgi:hypothetical protein
VVATETLGALFTKADGKIAFRQTPPNDPTIVDVYGADASDVPIADLVIEDSVDRLVNIVEVTRDGGLVQRATDDALIAEFGELSTTLDTAASSAMAARSLALRIIYTQGAARDVIRQIKLWGHHPDVVQAELFDLDIGSALTAKASPPGTGTAIEQLSLVERISHSYGTDGQFITVFGLTEYITLPIMEWDSGRYWDRSVWGGIPLGGYGAAASAATASVGVS